MIKDKTEAEIESNSKSMRENLRSSDTKKTKHKYTTIIFMYMRLKFTQIHTIYKMTQVLCECIRDTTETQFYTDSGNLYFAKRT